MRPAWSVILLTTLIGAGQGLFLVVFVLNENNFLVAGTTITLCLLAAGLIASFFHLGRPLRAWRAVSQWRTSWLSREVIVLPAFMAAVALYGWSGERWIGWLAVLLCLALFYCTGMIYACLEFLQEWHSPFTIPNFALLGLASGATLATVLSPELVNAALALGALAYAVRCASLARNAKLKPKSTTQSAIGASKPDVAQRSQGFTGGSYNTREFFHGKPAPVLRNVRWTFLLLVFPLPALLLACGNGSAAVLVTAFALQFAGLLAERWYFFAEARHPQNLYYQSSA